MTTTSIKRGQGRTAKRLNERGMIFSLDAAVAFTITLFSIIAFCISAANYSSAAVQSERGFLLQQKTMAVTDSFVKNYDENNALLGACALDLEKKRVRSNELSFLNFRDIKPFGAGEFFVKSVNIVAQGNGSGIFSKVLDQHEAKDCLAVKRFALVDGQKAVVEILGCLYE